MEKKLLLIVTFLLSLGLFFHHHSFAQVTLGASPYTQDFNSIGGGLPTGLTVRTGATSSALGTSATLTTTATAWNNAAGSFKNFAAAERLTVSSIATDQNASVNRALGIRQTGSFGDPGAAFVLQLISTSGLTNFSLNFKLQSLDGSATARTATWKVDYGFGATPSSFTAVSTNPATLTTTLSPSGWGSTDVTVNFGTALDNSANNAWIRIVTLAATTGSGSRPSTAIDDIQLSYALGDVTPPAFTSTYPKTSNLTTSGFDLLTNLNETGITYFVALADGASEPTSSQVKSGQDAGGNVLGAEFFGAITVTAASTVYSSTLSALNQDTAYDVNVVAEDNIPNIQPAPVKLDVRTIAVGDLTPPGFTSSYPVVDLITPTGFTVGTNLDEQGKTYFVVLAGNASAPTSVQVKNGHDANDIALAANLVGSINVTVSNTEFIALVSGLSSDTSYDVYFATEDNVPNLQAHPTKITVITGKVFTENFDTCDGTASFTQYSVTGDQVWGCTDFGRASKGIRMNGFSGAAIVNGDWLISPVLSLASNPSLSFYSLFSFAGNPLQLRISTDYSGSDNPSAATWTDLNGNFPTVAVGSFSTALSDWTLSNVDLSAYASQSVYVAFVYTSTATSASRWTLDGVNVNNATASYLQTTPSALSFQASGNSKSYTLKGINLQNGVTITAPTNFEVSKDNSAFSNSISYTTAEVSAPQAVYVRFAVAGMATDTYTGSVSNQSAGVATKHVLVKGTDLTQTFDVASCNLEFFGTDVRDAGGTEFGPTDDALQISNATTVMQTIGADIFAVQEISDDSAFDQLVAGLQGYAKYVSNRWSYSFDPPDPNFPPQKIGFIFNTATVQVLDTRVMFVQLYDAIKAGTVMLPSYPGGTSSSFWSSGRLPLMVTLNVTIHGITKQIRMIVIHAKSGSAQADYDRRKYDVQVLHDSLTANYQNDNIIFLGDFNDDVDASINTGAPSSYKSFVDDVANFNVLTYALSQTGASSFLNSNSILDHIVISSELTNSYVNNSIAIEDPRNYISNYVNTTSDHLPVTARFLLVKNSQTITFGALPDKTVGDVAFALTATASSGLGVGYTTTSDRITVNGNQLTIVKAGRAVVTAGQSGNTNYNAAPSVDQSFCIKPAQPVVTISNANTETPILTSSATAGNQWYVNGTIITGAINTTLSVVTAGVYKVQSKVDDCLSVFSSETPIIFTGDLTAGASQVVVYPNPAMDYLEIRGINNDVSSSQILDIMGRVSSIMLERNGETHRGSVQHLAQGVYLLRVQEGLTVHQIKFIKK